MKRTSNRGVKQTLKSCAYKRSEPLRVVTACLCIMNLRVARPGKVKRQWSRGAEAKASQKMALQSGRADAKPSDLPLGRLKDR